MSTYASLLAPTQQGSVKQDLIAEVSPDKRAWDRPSGQAGLRQGMWCYADLPFPNRDA
jgi:hypothetical protein